MIKRVVLAWALLAAASTAFGASSFFEKGEALFVQNKPQDAQPLLESALNDDPGNEKTYLYLGIIYQQLGDSGKAIDILKRGLDVAASYKDLFYYNMGNDYFPGKDFASAEGMYSSAIEANRNLAQGYLNRANTRLQLKSFDGALSDYSLFLSLAPGDPQRPNIEKVIAMLRKIQGDQEKARQAEVARQQAEAARQQAEVARQQAEAAAEAARQQALLTDVTNSLNNAGDDTTNLSVETIRTQTDPVNVDIKD